MVNLIRRFQRPLLTVLVIIIILSFVVFFNLPSAKNGFAHTDAVARLYGRNVTQLEVNKEGYRYEVCLELQMGEMLFALMGRDAAMGLMFGQQPNGAAVDNFIWNAVVLRHEAAALGITATDAEKEEAVKQMRVFQTNGAFNSANYNMYIQNRLAQRGLSQSDLLDVVADQVRLNKVRALLATTVEPSPSEVRERYIERHQQTEASFFRLKLEDFKAAVQVTDADVAKLFEDRKETLKTPEKRKVKFVAFTLAGEQKPLSGPERSKATERLAKQAQDFAIEMTQQRANFDTAAAKLGTPVQETQLFSASEAPVELGKSEEAVAAAFRLTPEQPNSDVVNADNGYYVLQLSGTEAARPLTLEEAKAQLTEQLKQERSQEAMNLKATELRSKIDADLKAGKPFEEAAKTAGVTVEKLPAFSAADARQSAKDEPPEASAIKGRAPEMKEGELSDFIPSATGGIVMHLDKRLPIDEAAFATGKATEAEGLARAKAQAVFQDWLKTRRDAAKLQMVGRG